MRSVLPIFLISFFTAGCGWFNRPPLDEEVYMQIRTELELIYMIHSYTGNTEHTALILDSLKAHYRFTIDEFIDSYRFYERHLTDDIARHERMIMAINEERLRIDEEAKNIVHDVELQLPEDMQRLRNLPSLGEQEEIP